MGLCKTPPRRAVNPLIPKGLEVLLQKILSLSGKCRQGVPIVNVVYIYIIIIYIYKKKNYHTNRSWEAGNCYVLRFRINRLAAVG